MNWLPDGLLKIPAYLLYRTARYEPVTGTYRRRSIAMMIMMSVTMVPKAKLSGSKMQAIWAGMYCVWNGSFSLTERSISWDFISRHAKSLNHHHFSSHWNTKVNKNSVGQIVLKMSLDIKFLRNFLRGKMEKWMEAVLTPSSYIPTTPSYIL